MSRSFKLNNSADITLTLAHPRLVLNEARRMKYGEGLGLFGLPCCSYTVVSLGLQELVGGVSCRRCGERTNHVCVRSRATAGRDIISPLGNVGYGFVHCGNVLLSRTLLVLLVLCSRKCRWVLEQPSSSCVLDHPSFCWFLERAPVTCMHLSSEVCSRVQFELRLAGGQFDLRTVYQGLQGLLLHVQV